MRQLLLRGGEQAPSVVNIPSTRVVVVIVICHCRRHYLRHSSHYHSYPGSRCSRVVGVCEEVSGLPVQSVVTVTVYQYASTGSYPGNSV
jgi:hypothetical protein